MIKVYCENKSCDALTDAEVALKIHRILLDDMLDEWEELSKKIERRRKQIEYLERRIRYEQEHAESN